MLTSVSSCNELARLKGARGQSVFLQNDESLCVPYRTKCVCHFNGNSVNADDFAHDASRFGAVRISIDQLPQNHTVIQGNTSL